MAINSYMTFQLYGGTYLQAELQVTFTSDNTEPLMSEPTSPFVAGNVFEVEDYSFDIEQTLNIGSQSTGAGAGKVTFNPFSITRKIDRASPTFFQMACSGTAFQQVIARHLRKSGAAGDGSTTGLIFLRFDFKLVAVKTISWAHDDESPKETVTFEYGGLQVRYSQQNPNGTLTTRDPRRLEPRQEHRRTHHDSPISASDAVGRPIAIDARELAPGGRSARRAGAALKQEVRKAPRDVRLRTFLFQMFCVFGRVGPRADPAYRRRANSIRSRCRWRRPIARRSAARCCARGCFAGARTPTVFGDPGALDVAADRSQPRCSPTGKPDEAAELRDDAFEAAPATAGSHRRHSRSHGSPTPTRGSGPMLEAMVDGKYYLGAVPPPCARWTSSRRPICATRSGCRRISPGPTAVRRIGFIPTRYPGSTTGDDRRWRCRAAPNGGKRGRLGPGARPAHAGDRQRRDRADGSAAARHRPCRRRPPDRWPRLKGRERLQPSLLDRLTDSAPEQRRESLDQQTLTMAQLRQAVLRDLALAAEHHQPRRRRGDLRIPRWSAKSTLNFGIPGFAGMISAARTRRRRWKARSREAIRASSRASAPDSLKVRARAGAATETRMPALVFEIEGELWAQPVPLQLFLETSIELETRLAVVTETQGSQLMDPRLLRHYETELAFLRDMGGGVRRRVPQGRRAAGSRQLRRRRTPMSNGCWKASPSSPRASS